MADVDLSQYAEPVRRLLGHAVRRQHGHPRRLAHRHRDGADAQRRQRPQHHELQVPRRGPRGAARPAQDDEPQGHHPDVHRHAVGPVRVGAVLVRRRHQHAVLPAQEDPRRRPPLLVPARRRGRGRQRPRGLPRAGLQPGGRPLLHEPDPRRDERRTELRLHRLPAAAEAVHARARWSSRATSRRTSRRPSCRRATSRPVCRCSSCRSPPRTSTTRSGRSSSPVAETKTETAGRSGRARGAPGVEEARRGAGAPEGGRQPLAVERARRPRHRLAVRAVHRAALRRPRDHLRRHRPDPAAAGPGLEPAGLGLLAVHLRDGADLRPRPLLPSGDDPHRASTWRRPA